MFDLTERASLSSLGRHALSIYSWSRYASKNSALHLRVDFWMIRLSSTVNRLWARKKSQTFRDERMDMSKLCDRKRLSHREKQSLKGSCQRDNLYNISSITQMRILLFVRAAYWGRTPEKTRGVCVLGACEIADSTKIIIIIQTECHACLARGY